MKINGLTIDVPAIEARIAELRKDDKAMRPAPWNTLALSVRLHGDDRPLGSESVGIARTRNSLAATADMLEFLLRGFAFGLEENERLGRELDRETRTLHDELVAGGALRTEVAGLRTKLAAAHTERTVVEVQVDILTAGLRESLAYWPYPPRATAEKVRKDELWSLAYGEPRPGANRIAELESQLPKLRAEMESLERDLNTARSDRASSALEIDALRSEVERFKRLLDDAATAFERKRVDVEALNRKLEAQQAIEAASQRTIDSGNEAFRQVREQWQRQRGDLGSTITALSATKLDLTAELTRATTARDAYHANAATLLVERDQLKAEITERDDLLKGQRDAIGELRDEVTEVRVAHSRVSEERDKLAAEVTVLRGQADVATSTADRQAVHIRKQATHIAELERTLKSIVITED